MELLIVLIIVGVLAFIAIPRLNIPSLKVVPVAEQIAAELRYAQNLAMTRSQEHTFEIIGNTISIQGGVPLSDGQTSVTFTGVSISGDNITFTPRFGRPDSGSSIAVSAGSSAVTIVVEGETGYVYIEE